MMIIDVKKLNAQKKYSGHMEFEYSALESLIEIPFVKFSSPVKIDFDYVCMKMIHSKFEELFSINWLVSVLDA